MIAVKQPEMRDELLRRGAHVGLPEALLLADDQRVGELLEAGHLPSIVPNGGSILAFARTPYAIDRLIALGAATDARDRWGATPLDAMSRLGARGRAVVAHMIARGVPASAEHYARIGDIDALEQIARGEPGIARQPAVLMAAVDAGQREVVEWLMRRGASANTRAADQSRQTALHSAAWNGDLGMVQLLVAHGADSSRAGRRTRQHTAGLGRDVAEDHEQSRLRSRGRLAVGLALVLAKMVNLVDHLAGICVIQPGTPRINACRS